MLLTADKLQCLSEQALAPEMLKRKGKRQALAEPEAGAPGRGGLPVRNSDISGKRALV